MFNNITNDVFIQTTVVQHRSLNFEMLILRDDLLLKHSTLSVLGVDRLSAWPIMDIGHFKNRFADNIFKKIFFFFFNANKHTIYR